MKSLLYILSLVLFFTIINSNLASHQNKVDISGSLWKMHLIDSTYSYLWFNCDSTYVEYDAEVENNFYGKYAVEKDTLILSQKMKDDYHKYGDRPVKVKSLSKFKYLIKEDTTLLFLARDGEGAKHKVEYKLESKADCSNK